MNIAEIRKNYPQYDDMTDIELADALYRKNYADMPRSDFMERIGVADEAVDGDSDSTYSVATRAAYGASEPITGLAQLAYNALPESVQKAGTQADAWLHKNTGGILGKSKPFNAAVSDQEQWYQKGAPEGFDFARLGGNIATGVLATRGMSAPQSAAGAVAQGAWVGAGLSAAAPVYKEGDFWNDKGAQVATGGLAGAALGPAGYGLGRVISPKAASNPDIQMLNRAGVKPSAGSTMGGAVSRTEEMAQSIPLLGDSIRATRSVARDDFNRSVLNQVVERTGRKVKDIGSEGIAEVQRISKQAYDDAAKMIPGLRLDNQAQVQIANLRRGAKNLKPDEARRFSRFMQNEFNTRFRQGGTTSEGFKRLDAELNKAIKGNQSSELGGAFKELQSILKDQAKRVSPEYRAALDVADDVFAKRVIVEKAANTASGTSGVFTPKQLLQATKITDQTVRKNKAAAGNRPFQDFAQAASRTLGDNYPDSGTAGRMFTGGALAGGAAFDPVTTGLLAGGLWGSGKLLYNPLIQETMRRAATVRPQGAQGVADKVAKTLPLLTPALIGSP